MGDYVADTKHFTSKLIEAARSPIPSHKSVKFKTRVPWFTQEQLKHSLNKTIYKIAPKTAIVPLDHSIHNHRLFESAAGPDGVYYQFLRHLPEFCLQILLKLFNNIWTTGDIPPSWREVSVVPISKPGKDPSDPSIYRPIALTSYLCKTLGRMVNGRLVHVLESVKNTVRF
ncbi:RNA-directed DNA polymerase from mobile element jockey [Plakobranchus ocellatus]|uniref:RNA-directed DNA polymerase from mobile element jockey n=1 Tax=Plakobranchus ocellatus TaxID=259542 RepID=A0AAV4C7W5_9GAST|nr:RNA-directed DNA polymerase from mobile element jockey [Plakobranchus ocellatus]